ncbi:unnamed protein product [Fraxinus pennsylvanica]|uniref:Uncharacterized protein n=1 Tax=Fraxinus pennsylvanica TaxID=56036 RepID=A0AAD2EC54_9LAMI|nr:unnamed protein product [Fraxinus pennsylvanica]
MGDRGRSAGRRCCIGRRRFSIEATETAIALSLISLSLSSCFNSRKLSPVFTGGPGIDEVPPIWVDRAGVKANITENFTRQSKFTYGLVMEEITTRDESSHISVNGQRVLPNGGVSADGPSTTLSGTGVDHMAFLQANITRDNTKFVNGAIVGERNVFQLDQGLGVGSKFPFFNRHQLTVTQFFQLKQIEEAAGKPPPPVLVLHGHYGGCVGDLPSYNAFTLGGADFLVFFVYVYGAKNPYPTSESFHGGLEFPIVGYFSLCRLFLQVFAFALLTDYWGLVNLHTICLMECNYIVK